jgi:hypothetical protein
VLTLEGVVLGQAHLLVHHVASEHGHVGELAEAEVADERASSSVGAAALKQMGEEGLGF